jgi:hypothetical protein
VAAVLLGAFLVPRYPFKQAPIEVEQEQLPARPGEARTVAVSSDALISRSMFDGTVLPNWGSDEVRPPPEAGTGVWWTLAGDPSSVRVDAVLDRWRIEAEPGTVVRLAQRDLPGWRCTGGTLSPGLEPTGPQHLPWWWLTVEIGPQGIADCRWRPPGLGLGAALQLLTLLALGGAWLAAKEESPPPPSGGGAPEHPA